MSRALRSVKALSACKTVPLNAEKCLTFSVVPHKKSYVHYPLKKSLSWYNVRVCSASSGFGFPLQHRCTHTDVTKVPDFSSYRVEATRSPTVRSSETEVQRKVFGYTMMFAGGVLATTAAKYTLKTFVMPLGPTAKTLAEASTEVNLANIPEGKNLVVKWRNKPLFIRHRTEEEIARERSVPLSSLRHPESDEDRVQQAKWLICMGICTHLGCVPQSHQGEFNGYYCPCHGSHYDASGRIRKGPAPLNLEVPDYKFLDDNTVLVG